LIVDVFIRNARNPHKGEATHGWGDRCYLVKKKLNSVIV
jgi:hypothetical protein